MDCRRQYGTGEEPKQSFLPLDILWSKCQEQQHVREVVAIAYDFIPKGLHDKLMKQIEDLLLENQIVDYNPHSNNFVRDIIHPALYSYVKGVSHLLKLEKEIKALSFEPDVAEDDWMEHERKDYCERKYEASAKYQWMPTYFDIGEDGKYQLKKVQYHCEVSSCKLLRRLLNTSLGQAKASKAFGMWRECCMRRSWPQQFT